MAHQRGGAARSHKVHSGPKSVLCERASEGCARINVPKETDWRAKIDRSLTRARGHRSESHRQFGGYILSTSIISILYMLAHRTSISGLLVFKAEVHHPWPLTAPAIDPHTSGTKSASRALRAHLTPEIAPPVTVSGRGRRGDDHPGHVVRQGL